MRITSRKLSILALVVVAALAMAPAASANSINILVGTTVVGTATLTTSGSCGSLGPVGSGDTCLTVTMTGGNALRFGGDVIGLTGTLTTGSDIGIDADSSGLLSIASHPCNANLGGKTSICITAGSGANSTTLSFLIDGNITGIIGFHVIGPVCPNSTPNNPQTCFSTTGPGGAVAPEPGTLGLLGTGLVGLAGLVRRRMMS